MAVGFILTLLAMPFLGIVMGVVWLFVSIFAICQNGLEAILRFFDYSWRSAFDPAYIPNIGLSGHWARSGLSKMALEAEQHGDLERAVELWKQNRRLYSLDSWYRLGECYENGRGVAQDKGLAYEHYYFAARHGCEKAENACERLKEHAYSKRKRKQLYNEIFTKLSSKCASCEKTFAET